MASTVVFDLGGVVLNWQPAELLLANLPDRLSSIGQARELAADFFESFRPGGAWAEFDRGVLSIDEVAAHIALRTSLPLDAVAAVMHGIPAHLQLRTDTACLLLELKAAGHRLVFLSNMPAPYIAHVQTQLDALAVFERGIYSSDIRLIKPEDEIFAFALREFGCRAEDCFFLDDNAANVAAATRSGWHALQFLDAWQARRELLAQGLLAD
ncbi:MAG: HAD-IA family hydrolase [Ideonella sp.]